MKKISYILNSASVVILWAFASVAHVFAQSSGNNFSGHSGGNWGSISDIINSISTFLLKTIMPWLVTLAVVFFFWNLIQYIRASGEPTKRKEFGKYSWNALIAIFIMLSVWGIIAIGTRTLFGVSPVIPQLPTSGS